MDPAAVIVKDCRMDDRLREFAIECFQYAIERFNTEQEMAHDIKYKFDEADTETWHCIVGRNFGAWTTFQAGMFIYFYIGQLGCMLFKTGSMKKKENEVD